MDDYASALFEHHRQQSAIQPHRGQKIKVERALPLVVIEHRKAARRRRRSANDMDNDVDSAETMAHRIGHERAPCGGGHIRRDKQIGGVRRVRCISSSRENSHTRFPKPCNHCFADPLRTARDQCAAAIQFEIITHESISSEIILSPSIVKTNSSSMGLPGKFPVSRLVTMVWPSF